MNNEIILDGSLYMCNLHEQLHSITEVKSSVGRLADRLCRNKFYLRRGSKRGWELGVLRWPLTHVKAALHRTCLMQGDPSSHLFHPFFSIVSLNVFTRHVFMLFVLNVSLTDNCHLQRNLFEHTELWLSHGWFVVFSSNLRWMTLLR